MDEIKFSISWLQNERSINFTKLSFSVYFHCNVHLNSFKNLAKIIYKKKKEFSSNLLFIIIKIKLLSGY